MSSRRRHRKDSGIMVGIVAAVLIVILIGALLFWYFWSGEEPSEGASMGNVVAWDVDIEAEDTAGEGPGIQIPGYESMIFAAGQKEQKVNIGNPADNSCYFVISLKLEDGTELFESDYLKPGQGYDSINLIKELEAGEYTGIIQYDCYSLEDKSPLNGASAEFRLLVQ